ncbi:MAG: AMP-binding protein, partial [Brucellaceae bacterium]|nr:AMP-binding protein [Brucellaceae bacterium]
MHQENNISGYFISSSYKYCDRVFYSDAVANLTYGEMGAIVKRLAAFLIADGRPAKIGILGTKSAEAYAGILAAGMAGAAYVPLNLKWPEQRIVT